VAADIFVIVVSPVVLPCPLVRCGWAAGCLSGGRCFESHSWHYLPPLSPPRTGDRVSCTGVGAPPLVPSASPLADAPGGCPPSPPAFLPAFPPAPVVWTQWAGGDLHRRDLLAAAAFPYDHGDQRVKGRGAGAHEGGSPAVADPGGLRHHHARPVAEAVLFASGGPAVRGSRLPRGLRAPPRGMRCRMGGLRAAVARSTSSAALEGGRALRHCCDAGGPRRSRPRGRCCLVDGQQRKRSGAGDAGVGAGATAA